jgi:phenylalanyl-tRNA synthetase beta chain
MKLSLSWIFDHINGSWKEYDVQSLVNRFNRTTAEFEHIEKITTDLHHFTAIRIVKIVGDTIVCFSDEDAQEYILPLRTDLIAGQNALIWRKGSDRRWAMLGDVGSSKEGLMPAFSLSDAQLKGAWKNLVEAEDYILHLDNKSVTHRPDLWGHRGLAREIAALLKLTLRPESEFIRKYPLQKNQDFAAASPEQPFTIKVEDHAACKRFAALSIQQIDYCPSIPSIAIRLARIDSRPLNAIVDATNYVMFDLGQPMHAFDADALKNKTVGPRYAHNGEKLTLLDGQTITLTDQDLVISDGSTPIALAGVMGGAASAVTPKTQQLFVEAACFDGVVVRKAAMRHKHRTEASARFEKSLDPNQVPYAIMRFMKLLDDAHILYKAAPAIVIIGRQEPEQTVTIEHDFIETTIGKSLPSSEIIEILKPLGFEVAINKETTRQSYTIKIPSWRACRDTVIPEDIVEEIARYQGYDTIPLELPTMQRRSFAIVEVANERRIKQFMAYSMRAREVYNYALFDEEFLTTLAWQPQDAPTLQNPISQHYRRLVTSLVPHLFKNLSTNYIAHDRLRFFELNRIWHMSKGSVIERQSLAAVWYDKHTAINFYELKDSIEQLFTLLDMSVQWQKPKSLPAPWFDPSMTAQLLYNNAILGSVGCANDTWIAPAVSGFASIIELDATILLMHRDIEKKFIPMAKFPSTSFDISMLLPLEVTVAAITKAIEDADRRIYDVRLIDSFTKEEWKNQKSLTFRMSARDPEKTLTKEDIDHLHKHAIIAVQELGAVIR